jgi:four helix bundle protein
VSDFKNLVVWRKAHALALNVDRVAAGIRGSRYSSLKSQMTRAAMSIPTNIVEGTGQRTRAEYSRFVRFSLNSASELEYHLLVAKDTRAMTLGDFDALTRQTIEIRKMLHGLLRYLTFESQPSAERNGPRVGN